LSKDFLNAILKKISSTILAQAQEALGGYIKNKIKRALKIIAAALTAVILLAMGVIFVCVGLIRYLSSIVPPWSAWIFVGIIVGMIGLLLLLVSLLYLRT
jgi:hypothetical protein